MNDLKKELAQTTTEGRLIVLLNRYAYQYANDPIKKFRCFSLMVDNVYAAPKFFEALISHLDQTLTKDPSSINYVLGLLHAMLRTKRVSIENCDFIEDVLNGHKSKLPSFSLASVSLFIKGLKFYRKSLKDMEQAFEQQESIFVNQDNGLTTLYGVSKPNRNVVPKYAVSKPNQNVVPKYDVSKPGLVPSRTVRRPNSGKNDR